MSTNIYQKKNITVNGVEQRKPNTVYKGAQVDILRPEFPVENSMSAYTTGTIFR